jgi:7,8-dihydroneopterin aldolase/epimerase/oxygenase
MTNIITISLTRLRFFAYHGLYAEERKTGNEFEVNLSVSYTPAEAVITQLDNSVNYVKLHELIKSEMQQHRDLLETFVMELAEKIHASFPGVKKVDISIDKLHPPIARFSGDVGVKYTKEY